MNFIVEQNRIFLKDAAEKEVAEVTFPSLSDKVVTINHTFVDDSLRGQGVAGKLMETLAEELNRRQMKARLSCSYAIKWFGEHVEYANVIEK